MKKEQAFRRVHELLLDCGERGEFNQADFNEIKRLIEKQPDGALEGFQQVILKILKFDHKILGVYFEFYDRFFQELFRFLRKDMTPKITNFFKFFVSFFLSGTKFGNNDFKWVFVKYLKLILVGNEVLEETSFEELSEAISNILADKKLKNKIVAMEILRIFQNNDRFRSFAQKSLLLLMSEDDFPEVRKNAIKIVEIDRDVLNIMVYRLMDRDESVKQTALARFIDEELDISRLSTNSLFIFLYSFALTTDERLATKFRSVAMSGLNEDDPSTFGPFLEKLERLLNFDLEIILILEKPEFAILSFLEILFSHASKNFLEFLIIECMEKVFKQVDKKDRTKFKKRILILEHLKNFLDNGPIRAVNHPLTNKREDFLDLCHLLDQNLPPSFKIATLCEKILQSGGNIFEKVYFLKMISYIHFEDESREKLLASFKDFFLTMRDEDLNYVESYEAILERIEKEFSVDGVNKSILFCKPEDFSLELDYFFNRNGCVVTEVDISRWIVPTFLKYLSESPSLFNSWCEEFLIPTLPNSETQHLNCLIMIKNFLLFDNILNEKILQTIRKSRVFVKKISNKQLSQFFDLNLFACSAFLVSGSPEVFLKSESILQERLIKEQFSYSSPHAFAIIFDVLIQNSFVELNQKRNELIASGEQVFDLCELLERFQLRLLTESGVKRGFLIQGFLKLLLTQPKIFTIAEIERKEIMCNIILLYFDEKMRDDSDIAFLVLQEITLFFSILTTNSYTQALRLIFDVIFLLEFIIKLQKEEKKINSAFVEYKFWTRENVFRICEGFIFMTTRSTYSIPPEKDKHFLIPPSYLLILYLLNKREEMPEWAGIANDLISKVPILNVKVGLGFTMISELENATSDNNDLKELKLFSDRLLSNIHDTLYDERQVRVNLEDMRDDVKEILAHFETEFNNLRDKVSTYYKNLNDKGFLQDNSDKPPVKRKRK